MKLDFSIRTKIEGWRNKARLKSILNVRLSIAELTVTQSYIAFWHVKARWLVKLIVQTFLHGLKLH